MLEFFDYIGDSHFLELLSGYRLVLLGDFLDILELILTEAASLHLRDTLIELRVRLVFINIGTTLDRDGISLISIDDSREVITDGDTFQLALSQVGYR